MCETLALIQTLKILPIFSTFLNFIPAMQHVNVWSSPRNVSTALMYAFAQRSDTTVVDEPLYAHYLANGRPPTAHPGRAAILASQEQDGERVVREVLLGAYDTPVVFFKQMTHHLTNIRLDFLQCTDHVLLIRDPRAIIRSYAQVIPRPTLRDIGVEQQQALYEHLRRIGRLKAVLDARELLLDPEGVLRQLCERLQLPFEEGMLHWPAGPRPEDGVWAPYWYDRVHCSTGFLPYREAAVELPEYLEPLAEEARQYYEPLRAASLTASA